MKILFSGGGTLGSVTPLLAIAEIAKKDKKNQNEFVWIGTKTGPEEKLVIENGIKFYQISSGKLRRYFSWQNFVDIFKIKWGFFQSLKILAKERPDVCVSAGGFVSTPVHFASWFLGIPTWVHNQDIRIGLTSKLLALIATKITVAIEKNIADFNAKKVEWIGNPVRGQIFDGSVDVALKLFHLKKDLPVVFVFGGGTGSARINELVLEAMSDLNNICQVIHLTGQNREDLFVKNSEDNFLNYHNFKFFTEEMKHAYAVADVVVSRGGFGALTELSALKKACVVIPKTGHQEDNVNFLQEKNAIIRLDEEKTNGFELAEKIKILLEDSDKRTKMGEKLANLLPIATEKDVLGVLGEVAR